MKLIVGLGNYGEKYENTRHNAGFMIVNWLKEFKDWPTETKSYFVTTADLAREEKTYTKDLAVFMNLSGDIIAPFVRKQNIDLKELLIIHDDLDIRLDDYKLQFGKGPKLHNGITSIEQNFGTKDFWRLRVGVESRIKNQESAVKGEDYVLSRFGKEEIALLNSLTTQKLIPKLNNWINSS